MKKKSESISCKTVALMGLLLCTQYAIASEKPEILVKGFVKSNSTSGAVPKILKLTENGVEEVAEIREAIEKPSFTLKSEPVRVQSDFKTVDISVLQKEREKEYAKKVAIVQEDLQSRIKVNSTESETEQPERELQTQPSPEEVARKQARVKEDIESRVFSDGFLDFRENTERQLHYPVKRSDENYYADEPELPKQRTTPAPKEEDSFFSIFESLFGSSDDDSQSKKKSKPEDEPLFREAEDDGIKENIKTVGEILKPLRPIDEPESKTQNVYSEYQSDAPEYRIVNNFHVNQQHKQSYKPLEPKPNYPNYQSFYRPTEKPFRPPFKPQTNGYEDYDLEEFLDKKETTTRVKHVSPIVTTTPTRSYSTTTTTTTSTTVQTTPKNTFDGKLKLPSVQKKNDYINRNRYPDKGEITEKAPERTTYTKPEIKSTTEFHYYSRPNHETKDSEIKTQKIQESPNFYNLINLPVRYSTKDTAIPLISTSYANTKIQGMGAHKYEKGANGKYPNHKYDQISTSTTQKPSYWTTKRASTDRPATSFRPSPMITKTTTKYTPGNFDKIDYDDHVMGMAPAFGGYGSKTGVEVKTSTPVRQTSTTKETPTTRNDVIVRESSQQTPVKRKEDKETEKTSFGPVKEVYDEYEYENFKDPEDRPENYPPNFVKEHQNELYYNSQYQTNYKSTPTPTVTRLPEPSRPQEAVEYEYYDYDTDPSTTTTTTTTTAKTTTSTTSSTPNYKVKYPSLPKEKIKTSSSEKVAVVVPSKNHDFYSENQSVNNARTSTRVVPTSTTTTTTSTVAPETTQISTTTFKPAEPETQKTTQTYNSEYKEPAPVFEDIKDDYTTKLSQATTTKRIVFEKPSTTVKPVSLTSTKEQGNANIVLVPAKDSVKKSESEQSYSRPEVSVQKIQERPGGVVSNQDYTTEFTVGVVHTGNGPQTPKIGTGQGHFVASSISTNPYGNDEPFRPIPKPPGMSSNFQVHEENGQPPKNTQIFHKRPYATPPPLEETEPIHEPHEFIPSPQFHRPGETKTSGTVRPGPDIDYDFEGIQTEPKPGQYVIFSKPQLNPEMNENQLKKKPEISSPPKVSNAPHYHEKISHIGQENQKHVVFNPSEGQIYTNPGKPSDKEQRPVYGTIPEGDDQLSLQLVPPRGNQHEKPYEGNFVVPEGETKESTVSYPRPHWEKNGRPSFLMNTLSNKNDMIGNKSPHVPPQMAATLMPPSNVPPQRFRRPVHNHMPPIRKNFNEAGTNVKPKPNLPNILPQFRPNAKVGSGPYHRPPGYVSNRRTGMNRYHEKEHGNFPYHIHHPDKEAIMHREYEMGPEIVPKFITNRGKLPSEVWNSQGMQKRFGQGPPNMQSVPQYEKVLRRHQRTPVTTLQMLKQRPGLKTQKTQVSTEGRVNPSAPLVPPFYRTYKDEPKKEENVYIVYPAKAPQKLHPDNSKVFIVSDTKSQKFYNFTKPEDQHPLLNPNKRVQDKPKFPYGFVKPTTERPKINRKQTEEGNDSEVKEEKKIIPEEKDEKIDMVLHMQSNNQWNEVKSLPDSMASVRNPANTFRNDHYRFSDHSNAENSEVQLDPPSEYHTSIKDDGDSAFTLGAVMHTMSDGSRKGQVTSVPLHNDKELNVPKLNVNERISNGKIVTVSMPLDVKQDPDEKDSQDKYQFQAPFQASSSLTSNESHSISQGWSIVKNPDEKSEGEDGKETETSTNPHFNFENFKPELIGGFKPIYELPDELEEKGEQEKVKEREE